MSRIFDEFGIRPERLVLTRGRVPVRYDRPIEQAVLLEDIQWALTYTNRWGGWVGEWSVLLHSLLCLRIARRLGYDEIDQALCAVHDWHEAYIGDMPGPAKDFLPRFRTLEQGFEYAVHRKLDLHVAHSYPERRARVKVVDLRALVAEAVVLNMNPDEVCEQVGMLPNDDDIAEVRRIMHEWEEALHGDNSTWAELLAAARREG